MLHNYICLYSFTDGVNYGKDRQAMKLKLLYVEDFKKCFEITQEVFGKEYSVDWRKNFIEGAMAMNNLEQYCAGVFDINLEYNPDKSDYEQTKEGLDLIEVARDRDSSIPIICASKDNYRDEALERGADLFMFKKEFWSRGPEAIDRLIKERR